MYLDAVPFYDATPIEMWGDSIKPSMMPLSTLNKEIEAALAEWRRLNPPKKSTFGKIFKVAVLITLAVGVAAVVAGGAATGATASSATGVTAGSATGAAASSAAASASTVAAGSSVSTSSALSVIKSGATYISKGAALYSKVTGKPSPKALMTLANVIENSSDVTRISEEALDYYLAQRGEKITDEKTRALLRERLRREQQIQAKRLREQAAQQKQPEGAVWWPLLIPAAVILIGVI